MTGRAPKLINYPKKIPYVHLFFWGFWICFLNNSKIVLSFKKVPGWDEQACSATHWWNRLSMVSNVGEEPTLTNSHVQLKVEEIEYNFRPFRLLVSLCRNSVRCLLSDAEGRLVQADLVQDTSGATEESYPRMIRHWASNSGTTFAPSPTRSVVTSVSPVSTLMVGFLSGGAVQVEFRPNWSLLTTFETLKEGASFVLSMRAFNLWSVFQRGWAATMMEHSSYRAM